MAEKNLLTQIITYEEKFSFTANYNTGPERFLFFYYMQFECHSWPGSQINQTFHRAFQL